MRGRQPVFGNTLPDRRDNAELVSRPSFQSIETDVRQVILGKTGQTKRGQCQRGFPASLSLRLTRPKGSPPATPLASASSRSRVRNAAWTTSLAFSSRPLSTFASTKVSHQQSPAYQDWQVCFPGTTMGDDSAWMNFWNFPPCSPRIQAS